MLARIRLKYQKNRIWIYPLRYILTACILSLFVISIDTRQNDYYLYVPDLFFISVDLAKTILSTLAGSLLSITTFTFSTIMVVLTMYSSQFSPRVLENFLSEKITLQVLGLYMGGFFYCILTLFFMRESLQATEVLSASIAVIYAVLCLMYFVKFLTTVSTYVQAGNLISRLENEGNKVIEDAIAFSSENKIISSYELGEYVFKKDIKSTKNGYLELVDFENMYKDIQDIDTILIVHPHNGDFIVKNEVIASLYFQKEVQDIESLDIIDSRFLCEENRNSEYDYLYSIDKLVEVALRAISPGINDPATAVYCINTLGTLMSKTARISGKYVEISSENSSSKIILKYFDFKHDLYEAFYELIIYGKNDIAIVLAIYKALENIIRNATNTNIDIVKEFVNYLEEKTNHLYAVAWDEEIIKNARNRVLFYD